jgi:hypothetical protein
MTNRPATDEPGGDRRRAQMVRIVVADDHPIYREGMIRALVDTGRYTVVGEASDGVTAVELIVRERPDVRRPWNGSSARSWSSGSPRSRQAACTGSSSVLLAAAATVIASQAVVTGAYSVAHQAIRLGYLPRLRIVHTSKERIGQIYVP